MSRPNHYYYTIDIAYIHNPKPKKSNENIAVTDDTIFTLTNHYPNCNWFFSNWNSIVNLSGGPTVGPKGKNAPIQRNIGFKITVFSQFEQLIHDIANTPGLFINMVLAYNNDTVVEKVYQFNTMLFPLSTNDKSK